jgi:membrane protein required for colicin V production
MPSYLDLGVLGVLLVSALLSMMRGFTREVLAIASWAAAAVAAYYFYPHVMPYISPYIHKEIVAQAVSAAAVFFVTLIIVSLFTVRLSDVILDSKIGALDRSLGFLFGVARGFLLVVICAALYRGLLMSKDPPEMVATSKTWPILMQSVDSITAMLPEDAANMIEGWIKSKTAASAPAEAPADESTGPAAPTASPSATAPASSTPPSGADKQKLDSLINKGVPVPAPAAPAVVPSPHKS